MPIKLSYFDYPNVGDQMGPLLLQKYSDRRVESVPFVTAEAVAVGSILDALFDNTILPKRLIEMRPLADKEHPVHVWGTGIMHDYQVPLTPLRPLIIHALRGPLTKNLVEKSLSCSIDCPLGDPGLLAPMLVGTPPLKQYRVGIVPHYVDKKEPLMEELRAHYEDAVLIDVQGNPLEVIREIAQCETILSTSLHGLIIADSFGIPSRWCMLSDKVLGNGFKYRDYYTSFGVQATGLQLAERKWPTSAEIHYAYAISLDTVKDMQKGLIASCQKMLAALA